MTHHKENRPPLRTSLGIAVGLIALMSLIGCGGQQAGRPAPPMPVVTVAAPIKQRIVEWDAYSGRLESVEFVEVRARIGGYLKSIHFKEGQIVNRGDLLFVVDPRPYEVELESANATMTRAQSQLQLAEAGLGGAVCVSDAGSSIRKLVVDAGNNFDRAVVFVVRDCRHLVSWHG